MRQILTKADYEADAGAGPGAELRAARPCRSGNRQLTLGSGVDVE